MLGGVLSAAGYYMGERLHAPREANPKGFFEDEEINLINEEVIAAAIPQRPRRPLNRLYRHRPKEWQRWMAAVPLDAQITCTPRVAERMARQTAQAPFCFKDPRFAYTLPAWRPHLADTAFLCVFRDPATTVASILEECRHAPYMRDLRVDFEQALRVWVLVYRHILELHRFDGDWVFLHYDQILDGSAASRVEALLGAEGDWDFPERRLSRSTSELGANPEAARVYQMLCQLAGYHRATR